MHYESENTVLVINDTRDQLEIMGTLLRQGSYRVFTATDVVGMLRK